jgi:hypothetical protein
MNQFHSIMAQSFSRSTSPALRRPVMKNASALLLEFALVMLLVSVPHHGLAKTLFVKADASPGGDGTTWAEAYNDLQIALSSAESDDEIWVAKGAYRPTSDPLNRDATFQIKNGVALYGGFAGTEAFLAERDWESNLTVLSGDIDMDDDADADGVVNTRGDINGYNSYHVVTGSGTDQSAVLDGFVITSGTAVKYSDVDERFGGGMLIDVGSPTLRNLVFIGNMAENGGGGMALFSGSAPELVDVRFESNSAYTGGGMHAHGSAPQLRTVSFISNTADSGFGGGLSTTNGSAVSALSCLFEDNQAFAGAAVANDDSSLVLEGSTFAQNESLNGSGVYSTDGSLTMRSSVFTGNSGTVVKSSGADISLSDVRIENSVPFSDLSGFGLSHSSGTATLRNVAFMGNAGRAMETFDATIDLVNIVFKGNGSGGMINRNTSGRIVNALFSGNTAGYGGGMHNTESDPVLVNVTFNGNYAQYRGGAMYNAQGSDPRLINCIFWNNVAIGDTQTAQFSNSDSRPAIAHSLIGGSGGSGGGFWSSVTQNSVDNGGNLDSDPLFVESVPATSTPNTGGNQRLRTGSPVVDAGSNAPFASQGEASDILTDLSGFLRIAGQTVDMGAYELQGSLVPPDLEGMVPEGFVNSVIGAEEMDTVQRDTLLGIGDGEIATYPEGSELVSVSISGNTATVSFADGSTEVIGIRDGEGYSKEFIERVLLADSDIPPLGEDKRKRISRPLTLDPRQREGRQVKFRVRTIAPETQPGEEVGERLLAIGNRIGRWAIGYGRWGREEKRKRISRPLTLDPRQREGRQVKFRVRTIAPETQPGEEVGERLLAIGNRIGRWAIGYGRWGREEKRKRISRPLTLDPRQREGRQVKFRVRTIAPETQPGEEVGERL